MAIMNPSGSFVPFVDKIEHIVEEQPHAIRVKKMIWSDEERVFKPQFFVRIRFKTVGERENIEQWLRDDFGEPQYQGHWWQENFNPMMLWVSDKLATFLTLKYGD